jgi:putative hydrolase of the HAD superfamily
MLITHLIFDLDGTLYPHNNGIWDAIASRMEEYMHTFLGFSLQEIPAIRERYYHQYGTTLKGLIENHNIDPYEYLEFVHDIPLNQYLESDIRLQETLEKLNYSKWIFTNADVNHAIRVLTHLGVLTHFEGILGVNSLNFINKPDLEAYKKVLRLMQDPAPQNCVFFDDIPKNLVGAKALGIKTILVGSSVTAPEIDQAVPDIYQIPAAIDEITNQVTS